MLQVRSRFCCLASNAKLLLYEGIVAAPCLHHGLGFAHRPPNRPNHVNGEKTTVSCLHSWTNGAEAKDASSLTGIGYWLPLGLPVKYTLTLKKKLCRPSEVQVMKLGLTQVRAFSQSSKTSIVNKISTLEAEQGKQNRVQFTRSVDDAGSLTLSLEQAVRKAEENNGNNYKSAAIADALNISFDVKGFEEQLFDSLCDSDGFISISKFLKVLKTTGLQVGDPRLTQCMSRLYEIRKELRDSDKKDLLDKEAFTYCVKDNLVLISRAFRGEFIIPEFSKFTDIIDDMHLKCKSNNNGKVASYIPQLFRCDPNLWGLSLCTIDGQRHSIGDSAVPFCMQSCSKPLSYALALHEHGPEVVHQFVGQEPSGHGFNEIRLDHNSKPHNPMINAGAMVITSLIKSGVPLADRFDYVHNMYKRMGGGEYTGFNNAVFLSERETADRNFALGYYLREHQCFPEGVNLIETLDFYFQLCSVDITCESGAVMAATLANGGICPLTGERVVKSTAVRDTLSLMHSCGMYDYSGQFAFQVGLPGKSGVSGAILLVVPNVMGICTYSPPLDKTGNSCRGTQFAKEFVTLFNFHHYDNLKHSVRKIDPRRSRIDKEGNQITTLLFAAYSGDLSALRRIYLAGMDMNKTDYDGRTALHLCAAEGHINCTRFLVEKCKVKLKAKDRWKQTPLDDAKQFDQVEVARYLEEMGGAD